MPAAGKLGQYVLNIENENLELKKPLSRYYQAKIVKSISFVWIDSNTFRVLGAQKFFKLSLSVNFHMGFIKLKYHNTQNQYIQYFSSICCSG